MATREEARARYLALEPYLADLRKAIEGKPNIQDVGIGLRQKEGEFTDEICFVVVVNKKQPLSALAPGDVIPSTYADIKVDVVELPPSVKFGGTRPLVSGISISTSESSLAYEYGTLGFFATRNSDNAAVLVSNEHVLKSASNAGKNVYQPKPSCCGCNAIGKVVAGGVETGDIDCAMATLSASYRNTVKSIGTLRGTAPAVVGETVRKYGARTDLTEGTVYLITTDGVYVRISDSERFSNHGDSGSAIVNADNRIVALLWGGTDKQPFSTVATRIESVVSTLQITVPVSQTAETVALFADADPLDPWKEKLEVSVNGRAILAVLQKHYEEVVDLVHHDRATTIAWNENKGPSFIQAYEIAQNDPKAKLPHVVEGVELKTLLSNMADVLTKQGSPGLAADIAAYRPAVLAVVDKVNSLQDVLDVVNGAAIHAWAVEFFWSLIWDQGTPFYLPTIARSGLKYPALGIDIAPFATVSTGNLGEITMFKEPVLGYCSASFTNTSVSGIDSLRKGALKATDQPDGSVAVDISLGFDELDFSGDYAISAGGGIAGCAIAGAAKILSGDFDTMVDGQQPWQALGTGADEQTDLALWYRGPLAESANGRVLLGAYYDHQDEIYNLQQDPRYQQAALQADTSKRTAGSVAAATAYYRNQQNGLLQANDEPAPTVGTPEQYTSGQLPYSYLLALAHQKVLAHEDPDGRYAALYNAMLHFIGSVDWVQQNYPGPRPVGGGDGILDIIAKADPAVLHAHVMSRGPVPVIDPETDGQIALAYPEPLDLAPYHRAYHQKFGPAALADNNSVVNGRFTDRNVDIQLHATLMIAGNLADDPSVQVTALGARVGTIQIVFDHTSGWWPGIFEKTMSWLATEFAQGLIKDKLSNELGTSPVRSALSDLLTGLLKKL